MNIAFVSNYYNHHQSAFCEAMAAIPGVNFSFIATEAMDAERIAGGWGVASFPPFVIDASKGEALKGKASSVINEADVVIFGSAPEWMIRQRQLEGKLVLRYSERLYKTGYQAYKLPVRLIRFYKKFGRYKNTYMLSASAFTAADFAKTHTFVNKCFKWGYFPECRRYDNIDELIEAKRDASILWVGRLIGWKHPEDVIEASRRLITQGKQIHLTLVGNGPLESALKQQVKEARLEEFVSFIPVLKPNEVRELMERAQIYVLSSDLNEGWGAVLNESMNSACAVVASHAAGSVPFMIENGHNGLVYKSGDVDGLTTCINRLLTDTELRKHLSRSAYGTIAGEWNAETAASRVVELSKRLLDGSSAAPFESGPCSLAPVIKNDWL